MTATLPVLPDEVEGDRLRRYETSYGRNLLRTLDALVKMRRAADELDAVVPASIDECLLVTAVELDPDVVAIDTASGTESTCGSITGNDTTQPECEPATILENHKLRNKANLQLSAFSY